MTMQEAILLFKQYLQSNHKQRTIDSYTYLFNKFERIYKQRVWESIGSDEIYDFQGSHFDKDAITSCYYIILCQLCQL